MYAYLTYLYGSQAILAWTWRSMLGGEEQYLFGLLDHDGEPSWKLDEFAQISQEAKLLEENHLFPRKRQPEIAVAYSFEDQLISDYAKDYYAVSHRDQAVEAFTAAYRLNRDCALVDLRGIENPYRVLILPGNAEITQEMADSIRKQLENGTTVIMTAFSAKVNEYNQVFDTSLPGRLSDVFGVKVRGFDRAVTHVSQVNVGSLEKAPLELRRNKVTIERDGETWQDHINYHEFLELTTAQSLADYHGADSPYTTAVSCNAYGKGKAIYVGVPAADGLIRKVLEKVCGILPAFPELPKGVVARSLEGGKALYVNTRPEEVAFPASGRSLFTGGTCQGEVRLPAYEVELLEQE